MNDKGRSMVEMLGVLAIIGVLSAGGLAGYSKAMFKHRMNETINITTRALQKIEELNTKDWNGGISSPEDFISYGIMEKCDIEEFGVVKFCRLPEGAISFELYNEGIGSDYSTQIGAITFRFTSSKTCIAFLSVHWEYVLPKSYGYPFGGICTNEKRIYWPREDKKEASISDISEACESCESGCDVYFIYGDF